MLGSIRNIESFRPEKGSAATKAKWGISACSCVGSSVEGGDLVLVEPRTPGMSTSQYTGIDAAFAPKAAITVWHRSTR